jgi:hypothetical protein
MKTKYLRDLTDMNYCYWYTAAFDGVDNVTKKYWSEKESCQGEENYIFCDLQEDAYIESIDECKAQTCGELNTPAKCRAVALKLGLKLGGAGFDFEGDYSEPGCTAYKEDADDDDGNFAGIVYFGTKNDPNDPRYRFDPDDDYYHPVDPDCAKDVADISPCSGHGTCTDGYASFACECDPGYTGDLCEIDIDDCVTIAPCKVGDKVRAIKYGNRGWHGATITAMRSQTGGEGDRDRKFIFGDPRNDAWLTTGEAKDELVYIMVNWDDNDDDSVEGTEIPSDKVFLGNSQCGASDVIATGAEPGQMCPGCGAWQCVDGVNTHSCVCHDGYAGFDCEMNVHECDGQTCSNHGTCVDRVDKHLCLCDAGWAGEHCEIRSIVETNNCRTGVGNTYGGMGAAVNGNGTSVANRNAFAVLYSENKTIKSWGSTSYGGTGSNVPMDGGYVAIVSTNRAFAALQEKPGEDGLFISTWGDATHGGAGGPTDSGYVHIFSNQYAFAALKTSGHITAWNQDGASIESFNEDANEGAPFDGGYIGVYSTAKAFAGLKAYGSISVWGDKDKGGDPLAAPTDFGYVQVYGTKSAFAAMKARYHLFLTSAVDWKSTRTASTLRNPPPPPYKSG